MKRSTSCAASFAVALTTAGCASVDEFNDPDESIDGDGPNDAEPTSLPPGNLVYPIQDDSNVLGVQNGQGRWYIAKRCIPYGASGSSVTLYRDQDNQNPINLTGGHTGPGYIFYALAPIHGGSDEAFVNAWRTHTVSPGHPTMMTWDGLLSFAYHHVWTPFGAPALAYDGFANRTLDSAHRPFPNVKDGIAFSIPTTWCYGDTAYDPFTGRPYPQPLGVVSATPGPLTWITPGTQLKWTIDVQLKFATANTLTVHYEYQFFPSQVNVYTQVRGPGPIGFNYLKEPKFSAVVAKNPGDGFTMVSELDQANVVLSRGDFGEDAQLSTVQLDDPNRWRARFGYGSAAAPEACASNRKCLVVTATGTKVFAGTRTRWFNLNSCGTPPCSAGLDQWAIDAGGATNKIGEYDSGCKACVTCAPSTCANPTTGALESYAPDRDNGSVRWGCRNRSPRDSQNRSWEAAGMNNPASTINPGPGVYFHGWEAGSGPDDCEPLGRPFTSTPYNNSFIISLSSS